MKQTINPIGQEINTLGKVINNKELMLVHLHLKSGEQIPHTTIKDRKYSSLL